MNRIYPALLILFTSILINACTDNGPSAKVDPAFRSKTILRSFSDTTKKDTFKIVLKGDQPKNMQFIFTITPEHSAPIYTKIIKGKDLLDNYKDNVDLVKSKKQVQFLQEEVGLFFDEENFLEPAVTENEQPDKNTPDKNFFAELKRTGVNGFQYRLGKESKVYIAWSAAEKKVKPYYDCCK